jgi:hypothetical protein
VAETAIHGFGWTGPRSAPVPAQQPAARLLPGAAQRSIIEQSRRLYLNASPAQGRLNAFRREYPGLEQRISQKVVASFLGITPQYMSQLLRQDGSK